MTLPYDTARCAGVQYDGEWREGCEDRPLYEILDELARNGPEPTLAQIVDRMRELSRVTRALGLDVEHVGRHCLHTQIGVEMRMIANTIRTWAKEIEEGPQA